MAAKNWNAPAGLFSDAQSWSPTQAPVPGDNLYIQSGIAVLAGGSFGSAGAATTLGLAGDTTTSQPILVLWNATLTNVQINNAPPPYAGPDPQPPAEYSAGKHGMVVVGGTVTNDGGVIEAGRNSRVPGSSLDVVIGPGATLVNNGSMLAYPGSPLTITGYGGGALQNNGTISSVGGKVTIAAHLTGTGDVFDNNAGVGLSSSVEVNAAVDAGQTFHLSRSVLQVDQPLSFMGQIAADPDPLGERINLEGLSAASWDTKGSALELFDAAGSVIDTLRFTAPPDPATLAVYSVTDATHGAGVTVDISRVQSPPAGGTVLPYHSAAAA